STGDLQPVFTTILANAVQVCDANNGVINRWDGNALHLIATHKMPPEFIDLRTRSHSEAAFAQLNKFVAMLTKQSVGRQSAKLCRFSDRKNSIEVITLVAMLERFAERP